MYEILDIINWSEAGELNIKTSPFLTEKGGLLFNIPDKHQQSGRSIGFPSGTSPWLF